ncbi:MAG: hypothetical protein OXR66_05835 [Candidatus Woesearchaeota archaeon]|nr:hypothetical protein [Candidatus Woesearchaeota archaeon]
MRGQAALEFVTTYGWALLIILVMIGTISYFGVLKPSSLVPNSCTVGAELSCADYAMANDGTMSLQLKQGVGKSIYIQSMVCSYKDQAEAGELSTGPISNDKWSPNEPQIFECQLTDLQVMAGLGEKVKVYFDIVYKKADDALAFEHTASGEMIIEVPA